MVLPDISENARAWIFYGFGILCVAWAVVENFFNYPFQVYLGLMSLGLIVCIIVISWNNINLVLSGGHVRTDGVKIP